MTSLTDAIVELPLTTGSADYRGPAIHYMAPAFVSASITRIMFGGAASSGTLLQANPNRRAFNFWCSGSNSAINLIFGSSSLDSASTRFGQIAGVAHFATYYNNIGWTGPVHYTTTGTPAAGAFVNIIEWF